MEPVAEFVAGQLKEQFNMGYVYVEQHDYEKAKECFENVITICNVVQYEDAKRKAYISLAKLYVLKNDFVSSFKSSALAFSESSDEYVNKQAKEIIVKTLEIAMKYGVEAQKKGDDKEALCIYKLALPFLKSPKKEVVQNEIKKLEIAK